MTFEVTHVIRLLIKGKVVPVLNLYHEDNIWGNGGIVPPFSTSALDGREGSASRPLYPQEKNTRYPLDGRLDALQSRPGRYKEKENLVPAGNRTPTVQPLARRHADRAMPTQSLS
jgi:hypothetical protein